MKNSNKYWLIYGLLWGIFLFIINDIVLPLIMDTPITQRKIIIGFIIWFVLGLLFGFTMKYVKKSESKS